MASDARSPRARVAITRFQQFESFPRPPRVALRRDDGGRMGRQIGEETLSKGRTITAIMQQGVPPARLPIE
jgi:hypothetical protein